MLKQLYNDLIEASNRRLTIQEAKDKEKKEEIANRVNDINNSLIEIYRDEGLLEAVAHSGERLPFTDGLLAIIPEKEYYFKMLFFDPGVHKYVDGKLNKEMRVVDKGDRIEYEFWSEGDGMGGYSSYDLAEKLLEINPSLTGEKIKQSLEDSLKKKVEDLNKA